MQRKKLLIFLILRFVEQKGRPGATVGTDDFLKWSSENRWEERSREMVNYHFYLCTNAGFVEIENTVRDGNYQIFQLTWKGHEYLDEFGPFTSSQ